MSLNRFASSIYESKVWSGIGWEEGKTWKQLKWRPEIPKVVEKGEARCIRDIPISADTSFVLNHNFCHITGLIILISILI